MLTQRPVTLIFMVIIIGLFPVIGWAAGPSLLTDEDMDGIYAKGIWVNFEVNINLPGGNTLSVPSISMPNIKVPSFNGAFPGMEKSSHSVASGGTTTPAVTSASPPASTGGTTTPAVTSAIPPASTGGTTTPAMTSTSSPASSRGTTSAPVDNVSPASDFSIPRSGILVTDNAMQGNSGLLINAPNSAVSMTINVVVLNNSTISGDLFQSANSYPTNMFLSFKSYMY